MPSFGSLSWSNNDTIKASISWVKHFMMVGRGHMSSIQRFCSCPNVFKFETYLNIDGFIRLEDGSATTGDHSRQWILGYNRFLRSCLLVETEL